MREEKGVVVGGRLVGEEVVEVVMLESNSQLNPHQPFTCP